MTLPAPNLDDRTFQDLVDEAKRRIAEYCPEWTDHNVSDPGVTLVELFAWMTDHLLFRMNQVPDRLYVKFLELIGLRLIPARAATTDVTFWLSSSQPRVVTVPAGTEIATERTAAAPAISFTIVDDLNIVPCAEGPVLSIGVDEVVHDYTDELAAGRGFACFAPVPRPGDAFLLGVTDPVPSCAVHLRLDCDTAEGHGVDPFHPPIVWEASVRHGWVACEVGADDTGGLNQPGDVILHIPASHAATTIAAHQSAWIRCRVIEATEEYPGYGASPEIRTIRASTIGGTASAVNAEIVRCEALGLSEGIPGQRFHLKREPVIAMEDDAWIVEVRPPKTDRLLADRSGEADQDPSGGQVASSGIEGAEHRPEDSCGDGSFQEWVRVPNFSGSGPSDRHFVVDDVAGDVLLGPAVRQPDGSVLGYGSVPQKGSELRLREYRIGGGEAGNVAAGKIKMLKSAIRYVRSVENRRAATGGAVAEDIENAKRRGPLELRSRSRAVTKQDYQVLARGAASGAARIQVIGDDDGQGVVKILVVPTLSDDAIGLGVDGLTPDDETVELIRRTLDERRVIGTRILITQPRYQGFTIAARVKARDKVAPARLKRDATEALYEYFHPTRGGTDGRGWPFGRGIRLGEIYGVLQRLEGTELVDEVRLFQTDLASGQTGDPIQRLELDQESLPLSYQHDVQVEAADDDTRGG
jgi:hypothetical protein